MKIINIIKTLKARTINLYLYNLDLKAEYKLKIYPEYKEGCFKTVDRKELNEIINYNIKQLEWGNNSFYVNYTYRLDIKENMFNLRYIRKK